MTARRFNVRLFLAGLLWCALVGLSWAWNVYQAEAQRQALALETARAFFDQILITRRWNAGHGGVYVPVTPDTPPNPYLKVPRRDLPIAEDLTLTLVNPAYMTRQLSEIARHNQPTAWEAAALRQFEQGLAEHGEIVGEQYRYMAPLLIAWRGGHRGTLPVASRPACLAPAAKPTEKTKEAGPRRRRGRAAPRLGKQITQKQKRKE
jgi:hypothetical protein